MRDNSNCKFATARVTKTRTSIDCALAMNPSLPVICFGELEDRERCPIWRGGFKG